MNLSSIVPHVSGPKRPQDRVAVTCMKEDFINCLNEKVNAHINTHTKSISQLSNGTKLLSGFVFCAIHVCVGGF